MKHQKKTRRPATRVRDEDLKAATGGTLVGTAVKQAWEKASKDKDIQGVNPNIGVLIG